VLDVKVKPILPSPSPFMWGMPLPSGLTDDTTHGESNYNNFVGFL